MNQICYRIYTEKKNVEQVKEIVSAHFFAFTIFVVRGVWNRREEESLVIEIIDNESAEVSVNKVAKEIKAYNQQEAILLTKGQIVSRLV